MAHVILHRGIDLILNLNNGLKTVLNYPIMKSPFVHKRLNVNFSAYHRNYINLKHLDSL